MDDLPTLNVTRSGSENGRLEGVESFASRHTVGFRATLKSRLGKAQNVLLQTLVVCSVLFAVATFIFLVRGTLAKQGIQFSFTYLWRRSGINISEGIGLKLDGWKTWFEPLNSSSSNAEMLLAGLFNSLKVAIIAIATSTTVGVAIGVERLSTNWLVRNLCFTVVEFVRNTPLLIQLVFWYFAVILQFPPVTAASSVFGDLIISQSGIYMPSLVLTDAAGSGSCWLLALAGIALVGCFVSRFGRTLRVLLLLSAVAALATSAVIGFPLGLDFPVVGRFGASGGISMTPEMSALLLAVTINSAGYTAEIVRGAIETLSKGQWEASAALGLSRRDTLRDIVLPQVFRVVLPSLGNRYISLTKDTSLGIAIGYPDLFNVNGTVSNQTGRNLEGVVIVMVTYLLLSWVISGTINVINLRLNGRGQRA